MNTCKTCKHWYNLWDEGRCGSCDRLTANKETVQGKSDTYDGCRVYCDSDPITTEMNFGCIHHSPEETES